jgi:hypothetical protein
MTPTTGLILFALCMLFVAAVFWLGLNWPVRGRK